MSLFEGYSLNLSPFFCGGGVQFLALELHVQVSVLYMPPSVQVLAFLGSILRGGTAGSQYCQTVLGAGCTQLLPWHPLQRG